VCRRIEINLRHRNKESLNPHGLCGQPSLLHGVPRPLIKVSNRDNLCVISSHLYFLRICIIFNGLQAGGKSGGLNSRFRRKETAWVFNILPAPPTAR
jgi:hypothetical protein